MERDETLKDFIDWCDKIKKDLSSKYNIICQRVDDKISFKRYYIDENGMMHSVNLANILFLRYNRLLMYSLYDCYFGKHTHNYGVENVFVSTIRMRRLDRQDCKFEDADKLIEQIIEKNNKYNELCRIQEQVAAKIEKYFDIASIGIETLTSTMDLILD